MVDAKKPLDSLIKFKFGTRQVTIDPVKFTPSHIRVLREFLADLRGDQSPIKINPIGPKEDFEDYKKRAEEEALRDRFRPRENESPEDAARRVNLPQMYDLDYALPILNKLIEVQNERTPEGKEQAPVTQEEFDNEPWVQIKQFMFEALNAAGIYAAEYAPKSLVQV